MKSVIIFLLVTLLSLMLLQACSSLGQSKESQIKNEPISRRDLIRKTYQSDVYYVVYNGEDENTVNKLKSLLTQQVAKADRLNLKLIAESEVKPNMLKEAPILFIGVHQQFRCLQELKDIPLQFKNNAFTFDEIKYEDSSDVFLLSFYPNPTNTSFPISIVTSNSATGLFSFLEQKQTLFNYGRWGFEHYRNNKRKLMGNFDDSREEWSINRNSIFEFDEVETQNNEIEGISFKQNSKQIEAIKLEAIYTHLRQVRIHFKQLFKVDTLPKINYEIFENGEQKGLMTGNTNIAHVDYNSQTAFVAISGDLQGNTHHPEIKLYAKEVLGDSPYPLLSEGLPLYFSENWQRKGYLHWFALLADSKNDFSAELILSEKGIADNSLFVKQVVGAAFCHFILETKGVEVFKKIYNGEKGVVQKQLNEDWDKWKQSLEAKAEVITKLPKDFYWKGFNFTHEGYQIYNGYISKQAEASLDRLLSLGSNSITIVPYSYMRNPRKPSALPIPENAGSENDASVIHTIHHAQAKGLKVLLKPQVWVGRNSWPGDIAMESEKEWSQFFDNYYRWIRHYALMAAMYEVEALCLGVEFSKATLQHPEEWRKIITEIRKIYKGPITYSANWGEEFEQLAFWDAVDYIGISCYYPLTKNESPSNKELIKGFEKNLSKLAKIAKKHDKPVLLTEIGFRSISAPWLQPHDYPGEQDASEQGQDRCYKIVFGCLQNKSWCNGMFWWKWPTTFDRSNASDKRFIPYNKAAEKTVKKWYSK